MNLTYRGHRYDRTNFILDGLEVRQDGIFRGTLYTVTSFHTSQPTAKEMQYRGVRYVR